MADPNEEPCLIEADPEFADWGPAEGLRLIADGFDTIDACGRTDAIIRGRNGDIFLDPKTVGDDEFSYRDRMRVYQLRGNQGSDTLHQVSLTQQREQADRQAAATRRAANPLVEVETRQQRRARERAARKGHRQ